MLGCDPVPDKKADTVQHTLVQRRREEGAKSRSQSDPAMDAFVVISIIFSILLVVLVRIFVVWHEIRRNRERGTCHHAASLKKFSSVSTLIVLGSGGHTTEILFMTKYLSRDIYRPIHYCKASTDSTSLDRLRSAQTEEQEGNDIFVHDIPRSREVGQSYLSSIFTTLYAFGFALLLVARLRPRLLLCNGPGTCIPLCAAVLWWRVLLVGWTCPIVFCESYCRVQTLSLTGKLLYHSGLAELFVVHWKELHEKYPGTVLTTTFIAG